MKQSIAKSRQQGAAGFEQFYAARFSNRWQGLKAALLMPSSPVVWECGGKPYYMDRASIIAAAALPQGGKRVLDMCAAPGGKALVLSQAMSTDGILTCNERSKSRVVRLSHTLDDCLSSDVKARVSITCYDGALMCRAVPLPRYDRILLDAPCSSERHVIADNKYLAQWSPARIRSLAVEQWALLSCAWRMLTAGGYLLYSTCALCTEENDEIIKRLLHKFSNAQIILDSTLPDGFLPQGFAIPVIEHTEYGRQILPDTSGNLSAAGAGPIYFALVKKCSDIALF